MSNPDYINAHVFSSFNKEEAERSDKCGCFYCGRIFHAKDIESWADAGETAICPFCGVDAVITEASGYDITEELLDEMQLYWFG